MIPAGPSSSIRTRRCRRGSARVHQVPRAAERQGGDARVAGHGLPLPVRPVSGAGAAGRGLVQADSARVLSILHNPAYAGAVRPELSETHHT